MTRRYALIQLLRLGGLTLAQIRTITGWPEAAVRAAVFHLCERGDVVQIGRRGGFVYEVAGGAHAD